jgi:Spy/CpxP family protein refolding chaperone
MRKKWLIYLLTFSLALNGATAFAFIFFWWQSPSLAAVSLGQKPIRNFLQEDMNLTNEQSNKILVHIDRSKQQVATLRGLMDSKRAEMIDLICSPPINKKAVALKMEEINGIQREIRSTAVKTVITILEALPPESRNKFGAFLQARGRACDMPCPPSSEVGKSTLDR